MPGGPRDTTQEALQRKTAELEAILRALPDLFFRFDAEGRFLDFSAPSSAELYAPPETFLGKRPREVMPPALAEAMERARAQAHASGALVTLEYELEIAGALQHFEARYVPFLERQTIAMVRNISERRAAEVALQASHARLRESQKLEAVGRLAGGVAHDFNNLLMIIVCYASVVARHIEPDHPARRALDEINKASDRATALTKQLLTLSRRRPLSPIVLDLRDILREMDSMLARVLGENIRLRTQIASGLWPVLGDRSQIEQVVLNLVLNARDAMPNGGELRVRAENMHTVTPAGPGGGAASATGCVVLSVSDTGCGMDAETQARMFEAFFTTKPRGTGLGLFTVQQITREYGGSVSVQSHPGVGTRFEVRLVAAAERAEHAPAQVGQSLAGGHESLLVVEDEDAVRVVVVELLEQLGYRVKAASSGEEALDWLRGDAAPEALDLLLSDVVMPGMSGWELAREVLAAYPRCRALYMSGHAVGPKDDLRSHDLQRDLLHKPFTPEMLAARVRLVLDRPPSAAAR